MVDCGWSFVLVGHGWLLFVVVGCDLIVVSCCFIALIIYHG